jgi:methionine aminopeptidase
MVEIKTPEQIARMRAAGLVVAEVHRACAAAAVPGATTKDLDEIAAQVLADHGAKPNFLGYGGFPAEPHLLNYVERKRGRGPRLVPGFCLAIEPMLSLGTAKTHVLADEWTVKTNDGTWAAHWEHSVALTEEGPLVLTAPDGGRERLAKLGVSRTRCSRWSSRTGTRSSRTSAARCVCTTSASFPTTGSWWSSLPTT